MSAPWAGKPIRQRPQAAADIAAIADYLSASAGPAVALRFIDAVETAYALLSAHPASGSPRHAHVVPELPLPLRFHPVRHFERILVYYLDQPDAVEVIRIWDASRGLEALLEEEPT
jgi:toxin ParE1/3/4